ncbi:MAG: PrsW family glutamic-type intramembrane protease, partial [Schwartzia succinivorans]|nr:PrsW family glutamic-type intramembrane protease [Schwartzia succinivorans]
IGAAVGMGFTLPEEILYGSDLLGLLFRIDFIAGHMIFGILMTYFLGMAKYKKLTAQGSPTREYVLALLVPMLMHTLYDTFTANNKFLTNADEEIQMIGAVTGIIVALAAFVIQIVILVKHKKNAEKLCSLRLS